MGVLRRTREDYATPRDAADPGLEDFQEGHLAGWNDALNAVAALDKLTTPQPVAGEWVLVPREPTYDQLTEGSRVLMLLPEVNTLPEYRDQAQAIYAAMLAASPPDSGDKT